MVDIRVPSGSQVLLLALIPSLLAYHALFGETPLSLAVVTYGGLLFVISTVAQFVDGGVQSPWYLLSFGLVTICFGIWRSLSDVSLSSGLMTVAGLGILLWGATEYRSSSARRD
ncbi:hypothetical protein [Salinigranum halophilum]|jgi:hypothetical protein|uniref:hypothetical protein n=1 Tax=Salinigranum halophilum TaxID=2565931 RepID=UPI0010A90552|nr:hypothetical protein [Salinigranum halophilum]